MGYFRGDIIEGRIILRTFLFITNNGTPEGDRLLANTGLKKEDKNYLAIDKISTFIKSDIDTNQRVKEIFVNAGCGSIFEIDKNLFICNPSENVQNTNQKSLAKLITNYLSLENKTSSLEITDILNTINPQAIVDNEEEKSIKLTL